MQTVLVDTSSLHNVKEMFLLFIIKIQVSLEKLCFWENQSSFTPTSPNITTIVQSSPFKEGRDYAFYMKDYKGETRKVLPFYMTDFLFTERKVIIFEEKFVRKMIYLISKISFIFPTQIYYNVNFITSSSVS